MLFKKLKYTVFGYIKAKTDNKKTYSYKIKG